MIWFKGGCKSSRPCVMGGPPSFSAFPSLRYTVKYMVMKQALAPRNWLTGSAQKTPLAPRPVMAGMRKMRGRRMTNFLSREKQMARLARPRPVKVFCPTIMKVMKKIIT